MALAIGTAALLFSSTEVRAAETPATDRFDVVVYGGSSGGVAAAVQARRMGKTAVLIEPGKHLGGLTSGGLGATDIGNKAAIGGISREFYQRVKQHYDKPAAWTREKPEQYRSGRNSEKSKDDAMWTFEPSVAERIMNDLCREAGVTVVLGERLDLNQGVTKNQSGGIASIRMESGREFTGKRFIDATYEGDLFALAGVSFHVGREANATYGETLNGVEVKHATKHQLVPGVDPYVKPGDPASGLLPGVEAGPAADDGAGDKRVQAYNFRMCLTDVKENQLPFTKPDGYDPARYELLLRNFEAGETRTPWAPTLMPNRKTDVNNNFGFSTDNIGRNYDWPTGDYATRDKIFQDHLLYQRGLMWTLANNPRVPEKIRQTVGRWGQCRDEFADYDGWPHQLYVREGRRMVGQYVMTQHNCQGRKVAENAVGLAAYTMDSHHTQRYVGPDGFAHNEGDVQVGGFPPYPIDYGAIVPKEAECNNLLVPVSLSASHIAFGSIRMEPVFMVLGQSAATAACQSIDANVAVQKVDFPKLHERLLADGQVLAWTGSRGATGIDPKTLSGLVIDDAQATKTGEWSTSASVGGFVGAMYLHDNNDQKGKLTCSFAFKIPTPGEYEVRVAYTANGNRATNVPVEIRRPGEDTVLKHINQKRPPAVDKTFASLGTYKFDKEATIVISNADTNGHVIADAVQLVPVKK